MNKEETKVNFDLSNLSLNELIKVYEEIIGFIQVLEEKKLAVKEKAEEENE